QAKADYKGRVTRIIDAIRLKKKPDRVPVILRMYGFPAAYCGYTQKDMWYDADKAIDAGTRCTLAFQFDIKVENVMAMIKTAKEYGGVLASIGIK
ncbi:MAG: hypothetical protein V3R96_05765, partial [Dehalococcoidales bacterium]